MIKRLYYSFSPRFLLQLTTVTLIRGVLCILKVRQTKFAHSLPITFFEISVFRINFLIHFTSLALTSFFHIHRCGGVTLSVSLLPLLPPTAPPLCYIELQTHCSTNLSYHKLLVLQAADYVKSAVFQIFYCSTADSSDIDLRDGSCSYSELIRYGPSLCLNIFLRFVGYYSSVFNRLFYRVTNFTTLRKTNTHNVCH